jgi:hypothetical protein
MFGQHAPRMIFQAPAEMPTASLSEVRNPATPRGHAADDGDVARRESQSSKRL